MNFEQSCLLAKGQEVKPEKALEVFPGLKDIGDLFRLAHIHEFKRDLSPSERARQVAAYHIIGHEPKYVTNYLAKFHIDKS